MPAHVMLAASVVASVAPAHVITPLRAVAVPFVLKDFDFVNVLDGVGQLVDGFEVAGVHVALGGDFVQLTAKHIAQVAHRFHTHIFLLSHACRVTIRFALATSIACALVFFSATVTQHPRGTSTNAETETLK